MMHQRSLVVTKLFETLSRGLFVLVCTYVLPLEEAGRFGLLATAITLLSFVLGFERYIDVQRQIAGKSSSAIRRRMIDTLRFFRLHYFLILPFALIGAVAVSMSIELFVLMTIVVVGEHLSNQAYQAVLLDRRAFSLLVAVAVKNALQLLVVLFLFSTKVEPLTSLSVLYIWVAASIAYMVVAVMWWRFWVQEHMSEVGDELPHQSSVEQYRASSTHFLVGVVAVAALQMDRLIVGGALVATEVGIYFRNVALAGVALQIFNIASFNRVAPGAYQCARESSWQKACDVVNAEYRHFALVFVGFVATALLADYCWGYPARRYGLHTTFVLTITVGVLLRTAADYKGLLLLALSSDRTLFRNQTVAVLMGSVGLLVLSWKFQLLGAFCGALLTHMFYFIFNYLSVKKLHSQFKALPS